MGIKDDFLGRGWGFPPAFDKMTSTVVMVSDELDIQQSLQILLNTTIGERLLRPNYGCNMKAYLFDSLDHSKIGYIKDAVANAILKYEARIIVNALEMDISNIIDGYVFLEISYTIRVTNNRNNIVFPFYLNEGTLLNM
jgi:phage baseplate assembly protein W